MRYIALVIFMVAYLSCGLQAHTLYWFTGAAVKKPTEEIAKLFNKTHKDKVIVIAGGTGQVLQQMILSKKGDIYGCMDEKFFKLAESKGLVVRYRRFLRLTPVFGVAERAIGKIKGFPDLLKNGVKIAAGNPKTMALGKTYLYILSKMPEKEREELKKNVIIEAINISQIVNYIKMNTVDAGLLFGATARVNRIKYISIPGRYNRIKTAYLVEMVFDKNRKIRDELFNFILKHLNIYKKYGYRVIGQ